MYDRDYYCDEQIADVVASLEANLSLARVLDRKEIENYLLIPAALDRAIARTMNFGAEKQAVRLEAATLLEEITRPMKDDTLSQLMARRHDYLQHKGQDKSQLYKEVLGVFERRWSSLNTRLTLISGKELLRLFRERVQELCGVTLTDARIVESLNREDIPDDMRLLLTALDSFLTTQH